MALGSTESGRAAVPAALPRLLRPYLTVVIALGLSLAALTIGRTTWSAVTHPDVLWPSLFLGLAVLVGELKPLAITKRDVEQTEGISTSTTFVVALIAVGGVGVALVTQLVASIVDDVRSRRGLAKSAFNSAQYAVSVVSGGVVFGLLNGTPVFGPPVTFDLRALLALLVGGVVTVLTNWALVGTVIALASRQPLGLVLAHEARFFAATQAVTLCLAGVAAEMASAGVAFLALLVAPALAVYLTTAAGLRSAHRATHDALTGLGNRLHMRSRVRTGLSRAQAEGGAGPGLIVVDLDHFKDINDSLGHVLGDRLLRRVAERLVAAVGDEASVSRLGGDEFAVVVEGDLPRAQALAQDLLAALEEPIRVGEIDLLVRASVGVAVAPDHGTNAEELFKNADIALYHAKQERNRISTFSPQFDVNSVERLRLLTDLRTAIEDRDLRLVYQPQVDLAAGGTVAVEALLRWRHPTWGDVKPDSFIPLAENSGLITSLTTYVLDVAVRDLARWRGDGHDVRMSVNVSARQMSDLSLPRQVNETLARYDVPTSALVLEVTETALLSDPARVDVVIAALRAIGVAVAVDDYGTGHASLGYLRHLAVDELKIDRSFVRSMSTDEQDFIIVRSTIALARDLGLRVVAEGIEDQETCDALRGLGCHLGQGYHLGRPVRAAEIARYLAAERVTETSPLRLGTPSRSVRPSSDDDPVARPFGRAGVRPTTTPEA